ncbi:MAG: TIR domain-containing protein [Prochloraceae cyanobacterium]|nr:TIR domain-containing protein [Prochloraceae cyanobacterium]
MTNSEENKTNQDSKKPLLFISHKTDDIKIADAVTKFVRGVTGGGVDVFQSTNPQFEGPRIGKELNKELEDALWRAGIVLLVYTSEEKDWSWCMWECGIAIEPNSPDTKVVVLQCLKDEPKIFSGMIRIQAWDKSSLEGFAKRFLDADFFPNNSKAVTGLKEVELTEAAAEFYDNLHNAIPQKPRENWNAWPFVRLQILRNIVDELKKTESKERVTKTREILLNNTIILLSASGFSRLFGRVEIPRGMSFGDLVREWSEGYPNLSIDWLDVIAQQVIYGVNRQSLSVNPWHRFRHLNSNEESIPGLGRIKGDSVTMEFDIHFFGVAQVLSVTSQMNRLERMYYRDIATKSPNEIKLLDLLNNLEERKWNRLPVLDNEKPIYVVHVSMVDRFLRKKLYDKQDIADITLADFLDDQESKKMCTETWQVVQNTATVIDAQKLLRTQKNCRDIFVTNRGKRDEPICGWLTDRDINDAINGT